MSNVEILDATRDANGGYKVDVGRSQRVGRVSSEWFSRPDDERFLSLSELFESVNKRSERSRTRTVETAANPCRSQRRQRRTPVPDPAGCSQAGLADPLELRPDRELGRGARRLPSPASCRVGRDQPATA